MPGNRQQYTATIRDGKTLQYRYPVLKDSSGKRGLLVRRGVEAAFPSDSYWLGARRLFCRTDVL